YCDFSSPETFRASACAARGSGFCVAKAALLAAVARACRIPARVGFADVRNHLATARLRALMGGDVFVYHGYADLYLDGRWVKAPRAWARGLRAGSGFPPLESGGRPAPLFPPYEAGGRRHMEYVRDRGTAIDVPAAEIMAAFRAFYPGLVARGA